MTFGTAARPGRWLDVAGRCASASTRTPRCSRRGACGDDVDGLARFADICVEAFADTAAVSSRSRPSSSGSDRAGIAVLERTVAACRDGRRAGAARRQARRHRLDDGRVRAGLPRPVRAAGGRRDHRSARTSASARCSRRSTTVPRHDAGVFVLAADVEPGGPAGAARPHRRRPHRRADRDRRRGRAQRRRRRRSARSGWCRCHHRAGHRVDFGALNGPILAPGVGRPGRHGRRRAPIFGAALRNVLPSVSREVLRHGPDIREMTDAVHRLIDDFAFLRSLRKLAKRQRSRSAIPRSGRYGRCGLWPVSDFPSVSHSPQGRTHHDATQPGARHCHARQPTTSSTAATAW